MPPAESPTPRAGGARRSLGHSVQRSRSVPAVLVAFVAGVLLATAVVPDDGGEPSTVATEAAVVAPGATTTPIAGATPADPSFAAPTAGPAAPSSPAAGAVGTGGPAVAGGAAPAQGNGGATFRGVTEKSIKITALSLNSNTVGTFCPRCGNGNAGLKGGAYVALMAAWKRDGKLPIHGRDLDVTVRSWDALSAEEARNACVQAARVDKPFMMIASSGAGMGQCVSQEFKYPFVSGQSAGDDELLRSVPRIAQLAPTNDWVWRNFVAWADAKGLLKGQTLGMYSIADSSTGGIQKNLTRSFRQPLAQRGYKLAVDMTYDFAQAASTDTLAVQRFQAAGVTVAFIFSPGLAEPNGFQTRAESVGYKPKYPVADSSSETTDALADVTYNHQAQDQNLAMRTLMWEWKQRRPAVPVSPVTAYCLKAYTDFYKRTLDVFDNDAEIRTIQHACAVLEVVREALVNAGPNLTETSFFQGLYRIKNFPTSDAASVTFAPGRHMGSELIADAQHRKERWQPHNNYFNTISPWYRALVP